MATIGAPGGVPSPIKGVKARRFDPNDKRFIPGLLITPVQLLLILLLVFPFILELLISLTEWQPIFGDLWDALGSIFTEDIDQGINYTYLVTDEPRFIEALGRTLVMSILSLCLEFLIGFQFENSLPNRLGITTQQP